MRYTYPPVNIIVSNSIYLKFLMVCLAVIAAKVSRQISQYRNMLYVLIISAAFIY